MTKSGKVRGFWDTRFTAHQKALADEERSALAPLDTALAAATDVAQKVELKRQIVRIKKKFKARRKSASQSLFTGETPIRGTASRGSVSRPTRSTAEHPGPSGGPTR